MMDKFLTIIRHAKSSWSDFGCPDFDRTLNKRGLRDAPFMATKLGEELGSKPDLIITSPAKRAKMTAQYFCDEFDLGKEQCWEDQRLYHAPHWVIREVVQETPDHFNHLVITAHNPGLTHFVNLFPDFETDNLPTTGIVSVRLNIPTWQDFNYESGVVTNFLYPKKYFNA